MFSTSSHVFEYAAGLLHMCDVCQTTALTTSRAESVLRRWARAELLKNGVKQPAVRPVASISRPSWQWYLQEKCGVCSNIRVFCQHNAADTAFAHWMLHLHDYQDVFSLAQPSNTCISFPAGHSHHTFTPGKRGVRDQDSCSR